MFRSGAIAASVVLAAVAEAQTVQLPTFNSFGVRTTIVVPDSGGAYAGGASGGAVFRQPGFLLPTARSLGANAAVGGVAARVFVIDHAETDRQIRGLEPESLSPPPAGTLRPAPPPLDRVALGKQYVRKARTEAAAGRYAVARMYYLAGIRRLPDDLAPYATAELQRMQQQRDARGTLAARPTRLD